MASRHKKKKRSKKSSRRNNHHGEEQPTRSDELRNEFWLPTIKRRRRFSSKEIKLLQKEFSINCSPCASKVAEIAHLFSTDKKIITTWFQNKRAKTKKLQSNASQTASSAGDDDDDDEDHQTEQEEQEEQEKEDEGSEKEEQQQHYDFDDTSTELSSINTGIDSDVFQVMNGDTALTTPTCVLHQQEHQNVISALSSPHYTHKHLSDYFSTYRVDLYYMTMQQDQYEAGSFFAHSSSSTTTTPAVAISMFDPDEAGDDATLLLSDEEVMDSPSLWE